MKIKRIILSIVVSLLLLSTVALAKTSEYKLQLFFQPAIMDDITGDVLTGINLKNVDLAIPQDKGSICGLNFDFEYDDNVFNVLTNNNGEVVIITDENTLIKDSSKIHATVENGVIHISYNDDKDLIKYDGTLCRFILIANNVNALWNSFDYYPIRFVEDSISVNTYNETTEPFYNIEGIDGKVGAYNKPLVLEQVSVNKSMVFSLRKSDVQVNGEVISTDAVPFVVDGMWMLPMRYFAEATNMKVEWNAEKATACAYGENKNLKVSVKGDKIYINSALWNGKEHAIEINGRIYIPLSLVQELYPNVSTNALENEISIYVP